MSSRKSILFFCSFPPPFTGQRIATKFVYDILSNTADVDLINLSPELKQVKKVSSLRLVAVYIQKYLQLIKMLKQKKYDYVYTVFAPSKSGLLKDCLSATIIKKYNNDKLITHLHCGNYGDNFKGFFFKQLFNYLIKKVSTFIFLSPVLNKVDDLLNGKAVYLNNTISEEIICTDEEIEKKLQANNSSKILNIYFISNMIKEKGYNDLIAAAEILLKKNEFNFQIHLIGSWTNGNEEQKNLEKTLHNSGFSDKVIIYGAVNDRQKIKEYFLNADVFALPTYYPVEAQPLSILEALNAATPVISTYHASIPDLIENNVNGYLVQPKDVNAIAEAITSLNNKQNWMRMAKQARESYQLKYDPSIFTKKLGTIFI